MEFPGVGRRRIVGRFDGGTLSSDAGALLLRDVEERTGLLAKVSRCFTDYRDPRRIEHSVEDLIAQRVVGLALATVTAPRGPESRQRQTTRCNQHQQPAPATGTIASHRSGSAADPLSGAERTTAVATTPAGNHNSASGQNPAVR